MTPGNRLLTGTPFCGKSVTVNEPRPTGAAFCVSALPHDVATYETPSDYNWRVDAYHSYLLAIHLKALAIGAKQFQTISEMYFQESHGVIP